MSTKKSLAQLGDAIAEKQSSEAKMFPLKNLQDFVFANNSCIEETMSTRLTTTIIKWDSLNADQKAFYELNRSNDLVKNEDGKIVGVYKNPSHTNLFMLYLDHQTVKSLFNWVLRSAIIRYRDSYLKKDRILDANGKVVAIADMNKYLSTNKSLELKLVDLEQSIRVSAPVEVTVDKYLSSLPSDVLEQLFNKHKAKQESTQESSQESSE